MENDGFDNRGAGANLNTDDDVTVTFLPLVDSERKLLHIHFLSAQEVRTSPTVSTDSFVCLFKCTCFFVMGMKHLCKRFLLSVSMLACEGQSFSTSIRYPEIGLVIWFRLMATFVSPSDG